MRRFGELEAVIMDRLWESGRPVLVREMVDDLRDERALAYYHRDDGDGEPATARGGCGGSGTAGPGVMSPPGPGPVTPRR